MLINGTLFYIFSSKQSLKYLFINLEIMEQEGSQREDLPLFYKIILKVPKLSLDALSGNEKLHGIFWAAILPLFF